MAVVLLFAAIGFAVARFVGDRDNGNAQGATDTATSSSASPAPSISAPTTRPGGAVSPETSTPPSDVVPIDETTTLVPVDVAVTVFGRVRETEKQAGFSATRIADGVLLGPLLARVDGYGDVAVPADTKIGRLCVELEVIIGTEEPVHEPCFIGFDLGSSKGPLSMVVARVDSEGMPYVLGELVEVRDGSVVLRDRRRDQRFEWATLPDVSYVCEGPPGPLSDHPEALEIELNHILHLNDSGVVVLVQCQLL